MRQTQRSQEFLSETHIELKQNIHVINRYVTEETLLPNSSNVQQSFVNRIKFLLEHHESLEEENGM